MADRRCPKCGGSDYYWGKKLKADGLGGVVEGPESLCRKCDVSMNVTYSSAENFGEALRIGMAVIVAAGLMFMLFLFMES
jgi:hypothetical protein